MSILSAIATVFRPQAAPAPAAPASLSSEALVALANAAMGQGRGKGKDAAGQPKGRATRLTKGLSPEIMATYLDEWYLGRYRNIAMLWDVMQESDPVCAPAAEKRLAKISAEVADYTVEALDDSPASQAQANFLRGFFGSRLTAEHGRQYTERGGLRKAAEFLCDAVGKKYSFCAKVWEGEGDELSLRLRFVPLWHFYEKEEDGVYHYRYCPNPDSTLSSSRVDPSEWVVAVRRRAVMQAAGLAVLLRRLPVQQVARALEKFGIPTVYGSTTAEFNSPGWQALYNAIVNLGSDMSAVVSEGTEINLVESNFRAAGVHKTHLDACTSEIIINWLGGELGTMSKSGSGTLAGGAQADDLDDIIRDDCDWIAEIFNEQIAADALAIRFPGQPVLARVLVRKPDNLDDAGDMDIVERAVALGARVPASYVYDRFGLPEAGDGDVPLSGGGVLPEAVAATPAPDGAAVQDTAAIQAVALNGAQVQSLLEVIQQVALRQLPRETAVQIVTSAFGLDDATADSLLGDVGKTFFVDPQQLAKANALRLFPRPHAAGRKARDRRPDLDRLAANSLQPVGTAYAALLQPLLERLAALPEDAPAGAAAAILDAYQFPAEALDAFAETMAQVSFCAAMMGGEPIRAGIPLANASASSPTGHRQPATGHRANATGVGDYAPLPFEAARDFWRAKQLVQEFAGDEALATIWAQSRVVGFKVAGISSESLLRQAHADLDRAIKGEEPAAKVARALRDKYGLGARHAETVVRTNVQSAYSWGNWQQLSAPSVVEAFPLLAFDVTEDERTSGICAPLANKAYPREHPIWASMYPPNHYNCRTTVYPTTAEEAGEDGFEVMDANAPMRTEQGYEILPDKSFTGNIGLGQLAEIIQEPA